MHAANEEPIHKGSTTFYRAMNWVVQDPADIWCGSPLYSQEYLQQYYSLQKEPLGRMKRSGPAFISKVKDMQIFFGLNATGALDSDTLEAMSSPRCGVPDVEEYSHIQGTRWNKNVITYRYLCGLLRCLMIKMLSLFLLLNWSRIIYMYMYMKDIGMSDLDWTCKK